MSDNKPKGNELLLNPVIGLSPVVVLLLVELFFGLTIALYAAIITNALVLLHYFFNKVQTYQAILIINLIIFFVFYLFFLSEYFQLHYSIYLPIFSNLLVVGAIIISLAIRPILYPFFQKNFVGTSKQMECNLREFYLASKVLLLIVLVRTVLYLVSYFIYTSDFDNLNIVTARLEIDLILVFIVIESIRVMYIRKKLLAEDFWPIVNKDGVVIGKIARVITLRLSDCSKEMHPVVHVHIIKADAILLFRSEAPDSDGRWECAISEHVMYAETMDQTIKRVGLSRYGLPDFKPHFLLKHLVERELENQYVLLYYTSSIETVSLLDGKEGQLKYWPAWQIEENLGKGVFKESFEIEYDYLKNTVMIAEQFANLVDDGDDEK